MLNGVHRHILQDRVVYGRPALEVLGELLEAYGKRRVLVVSTRSISGPNGLASRIAADLGERCVGLYGGIGAHAPRQGVIEAALEARRTDADIIVGIGGGSVADASKAVQIAVWQGLEKPSDLEAYRSGVRGGAAWTDPSVTGFPRPRVSVNLLGLRRAHVHLDLPAVRARSSSFVHGLPRLRRQGRQGWSGRCRRRDPRR